MTVYYYNYDNNYVLKIYISCIDIYRLVKKIYAVSLFPAIIIKNCIESDCPCA